MVTYPVNAVNESGASGLVNFDGTSAFSTTALTQYNVLTGASNKTVNNVAPSATSGIPLVSGGSAAQPSFGTAVVAGGGTGATSLSGIVLGNGTSAMTTLSFTDWTSFMPTLFGATACNYVKCAYKFSEFWNGSRSRFYLAFRRDATRIRRFSRNNECADSRIAECGKL